MVVIHGRIERAHYRLVMGTVSPIIDVKCLKDILKNKNYKKYIMVTHKGLLPKNSSAYSLFPLSTGPFTV